MSENVLLEIKGLKTYFYTFDGVVKALDGVDLTVFEDETLGIVGETGCGKSVTSLSVLNLVPPPGRIEAGEIWFEGENLLTKSPQGMRRIRGERISMIFQDPMSSLNPVFTIGDQITTVLRVHQGLDKAAAQRRAVEIFRTVRLPDAQRMLGKYPHELSGGMSQRVMIGMALSCRPRLLIADEPTTALDVTIQAQILALLDKINREHGTAVVLVTHNLGVVAEFCESIIVMYAGQVMEKGAIDPIVEDPKHPYTCGLLRCLPRIDARRKIAPIPGLVPDLAHLPPGCPFAPRCNSVMAECTQDQAIPLEKLPDGRLVRCLLY